MRSSQTLCDDIRMNSRCSKAIETGRVKERRAGKQTSGSSRSEARIAWESEEMIIRYRRSHLEGEDSEVMLSLNVSY